MARYKNPRARNKRNLKREKPTRADYDRILIVCEGGKTEPEYFNEIRIFHRLTTANIQVFQSAYGTTPQQVVGFARDKCNETRQWEKVYCVFDRDDHPNFNNALQSAAATDNKIKNDLKKPIRFIAIKSIPCFELWLLLHFHYQSGEIHRSDVIDLLRQANRLIDYEKGQGGHFLRTRDLLETAYTNTDRLRKEQMRTGRENPCTDVDVLVKVLYDLIS